MKKILFAAAIAALSPVAAHSANDSVLFSGTLGGTCVLNVLNGGTLSVDGTLQNLNSLGSPGSATAYTTTGGFGISMSMPAITSRPALDTGPESSIGGAIHITGATANNVFQNVVQPLNAGNHSVDIFVFASKNGSNFYYEGDYTATTTLTCE